MKCEGDPPPLSYHESRPDGTGSQEAEGLMPTGAGVQQQGEWLGKPCLLTNEQLERGGEKGGRKRKEEEGWLVGKKKRRKEKEKERKTEGETGESHFW